MCDSSPRPGPAVTCMQGLRAKRLMGRAAAATFRTDAESRVFPSQAGFSQQDVLIVCRGQGFKGPGGAKVQLQRSKTLSWFTTCTVYKVVNSLKFIVAAVCHIYSISRPELPAWWLYLKSLPLLRTLKLKCSWGGNGKQRHG